MKWRTFSFILFIMTMGCTITFNNESPPPISDESELYENEYFKISYPKGWIVKIDSEEGTPTFNVWEKMAEENLKIDEILTVAFIYEAYSEYCIIIDVQRFHEDERKELDWGFPSGSMAGMTDHLISGYKSKGYTHFSNSSKPVTIGELPGLWKITRVSDDSGRLVISNTIVLNGRDYLYCIGYNVSKDFSEAVIKRMESVVNSFSPKKFSKVE